MSITRFTNHNLDHISDRLKIALALIATETGLEITLDGCRYDNNTAKFKVVVKTVDEDGNAFDEDAANFTVFAGRYGLKETDLGREFRCGDNTYAITGLKPRARKRPILAKNRQGKVYVFPAQTVVAGLIDS